MGAKASLAEDLRSVPGPSPTLDNIQATYEAGESDAARELIKQACCVECSAGMPPVDGVSYCVEPVHSKWTQLFTKKTFLGCLLMFMDYWSKLFY